MSSGVYLRTEYHNKINSLGSYKKWQKSGYREKMSIAHSKEPKLCLDCSKVLSDRRSKKCRKCDSISQKSRDFSYMKPCSEIRKLRISMSQKGKPRPQTIGIKNGNWQGGKSFEI